MASTKTKVKPIRIANETAEYFEGKPLNRIVECIHLLLENGKLVFDGEGIKIPGGASVYTNVLGDIETMAELFGTNVGEMTEQFCEMLDDGQLTVVRGRLEVVKPEWAERFEDYCHDRDIPVEKMVESVIKGMK